MKNGTPYSAILKKHPVLKSKTNLFNLTKYIEKSVVPEKEKLDFIQKHMWNTYKAVQSRGQTIHDVDLKSWAMEGAQIVGLTGFKASGSAIQSFRKRYGLMC